MEREVLKMALEALEEAWYHVGTFQPTEKAIDLYDEARAAIKAALAQPAQDYIAKNPLGGPAKVFDAIADCIRAGDSIESVMATYGLAWAQDVPETGFGNMAQPAQEPVAYLTKRKIGGTEGLLRADMVDRSAKNQETHDFIPLYTTSPQPAQEPYGYDWSMLEAAQESLREHMARIKELEAALAQPAQDPVGYEHHEYRPFGAPGEIRIHAILKSQYLLPDGLVAGDFQWLIDQYKVDKNTIKLQPLYTTPPQREWVGLTDDEMWSADYGGSDIINLTYAKAIEAKLKEKNT